jgi:hypothetical protein
MLCQCPLAITTAQLANNNLVHLYLHKACVHPRNAMDQGLQKKKTQAVKTTPHINQRKEAILVLGTVRPPQ